jgi:hypothetical protein
MLRASELTIRSETWSTGGSPPFKADLFTTENTNEPYLTFLDYILSQPDPLPSVISTSYDDDEQTVPKDYAIETCKRFAQLGARGVTVLFASGDNGIGQDGYCYSNDGKNTSTFLPNYPSTCPYITSVGGTYKVNPEGSSKSLPVLASPSKPVITVICALLTDSCVSSRCLSCTSRKTSLYCWRRLLILFQATEVSRRLGPSLY